jgi:hypothetical protein
MYSRFSFPSKEFIFLWTKSRTTAGGQPQPTAVPCHLQAMNPPLTDGCQPLTVPDNHSTVGSSYLGMLFDKMAVFLRLLLFPFGSTSTSREW